MWVETEAGTWHVRRRWSSRRLGAESLWGRFRGRSRRARRRAAEVGDVGGGGCLPDLADGVVVAAVAIVVALLVVFIGIPFLIALGELLLLAVLAAGGLVGRVLFRRPWTVDAAGPDGAHHAWSVVGWRASGAARAFIAERIGTAGVVPSDHEVAAAALAA